MSNSIRVWFDSRGWCAAIYEGPTAELVWFEACFATEVGAETAAKAAS